MKAFIDYLQEIHAKDYHGDDDNMPDSFEAWLAMQDGNELIAYAEEAVFFQNQRIEKLMKLTEEAIGELQKISEIVQA